MTDSGPAAALLAWFGAGRRAVSGRGDSDPYRVWVAEVMAQQTRVATVAKYYEKFLRHFPTVHELAAAPLDEVLREWAGLGYYARARNLHATAREVVAEYEGEFPADVEALLELPGVGTYTAGAVASLAFGLPVPAVDGNVLRVMSRLHDEPRPSPGFLKTRVLELIGEADGDAASVNQALMDLGSSVCRPRRPQCGQCPVQTWCQSHASGNVEERPARKRRAELPHVEVAVAVVWSANRVLIARRPDSGLLGGLWEFPGGKVVPGESPSAAARRELREEMSIDIEVGPLAGRIEHAYSHFRVTMHAFHAHLLRSDPPPAPGRPWTWATTHELDAYAFPAATRRLISQLPTRHPEVSARPAVVDAVADVPKAP